MKYKITILFYCLFAIFLMVACNKDVAIDEETIPENTKVIIRANTVSASGVATSNPRTEFVYYDSKGEYLTRSIVISEEQFDHSLISADGYVCTFFKNKTHLRDMYNSYLFENYDNKVSINGKRFGPSELGYIDSLKTFYALRNVGKKNNDVPYYCTIRFASSIISYDVAIPYYVEDICYDDEIKQFICIIDPTLNHLDTHQFLNYVIVRYVPDLGEFVLEDKVHTVDNKAISSSSYSYPVAHRIQGHELHEFLVSWTSDDIHGKGMLNYSRYNINDDVLIENVVIKDEYDLGLYGGVLESIGTFTQKETSSAMYVITNDDVLYMDSNEGVSSYVFPFTFGDSLSVFKPLDKIDDAEKNMSFLDTRVRFDDSGIYVLTIGTNNMLQIYKYIFETEGFDLYWAGSLWPAMGSDLIIDDFVIVQE